MFRTWCGWAWKAHCVRGSDLEKRPAPILFGTRHPIGGTGGADGGRTDSWHGTGVLVLNRVDATLNTEIYCIPLVINPSTHGFACGVIVVAAILSGLVVRRRLDKLDLIAMLKTRE